MDRKAIRQYEMLVRVRDFGAARGDLLRVRDASRDARVAARVQFETALASGLDAVRKLDVLVPNRLKGDPASLAVWDRDRRIEYPRGKGPMDTPIAAPASSSSTDAPPLPDSPAPVEPDAEAA